MATIIENNRLSRDFYLMRTEHTGGARMGQFYMLRAWDYYPVLSRPISVFDRDSESVTFLYKVVGKGTRRFAEMGPGEEITLQGPYGNGFPAIKGRVAMVGGGVGIAPLYLAARELGAAGASVDLFLGFSDEAVLTEAYEKAADRVCVNVGGLITDDVTPADYDAVFTCGPEIMMKALYDKCAGAGVADRLWVSMENRMACGVGACLVCSCATVDGNRKACKDGPVFSGEAVFGR